jgi:hypothetical protein
MREEVLNIRGFFVLIATLATLLAAGGCGSSGSSSNDEVTVQTGSMTKAEFIAKADAVCKAAHDEFRTKYTSFLRAHQSSIGNKQKEEALFGEFLESILSPNIEAQIKKISEIGAPKDYAPQVSSFLNALQEELDEVNEDPSKLSASLYPFRTAETIAEKAGMNGCTTT